MNVTNHYELLGVSPQATTDEIKRAFRSEISRYHPDKVQHLGREFQALAADRAADLTRAYRVLTDAQARAAYDEDLRRGEPRTEPPAAAPATEPTQPPPPPWTGAEAAPPPRDRAGDELVGRVALSRFREAVAHVAAALDAVPSRGFDVSATCAPQRALFRKAEPDLRLVARFVPLVDAAAIDEAWPLALRVARPPADLCVFLMGLGLADKGELAGAIDRHRRQSRGRADRLFLLPVDVRDWQALIPTGAPPLARAIIDRLRNPS